MDFKLGKENYEGDWKLFGEKVYDGILSKRW